MKIYAIHTPDPSGAPMNETALCEDHLDIGFEFGLDHARDADDAPGNPIFTVVESPQNNDTVCTECGHRG